MARWNLADLSKLSPALQNQVIAQTGPKGTTPVSSPEPEIKSPLAPKEPHQRVDPIPVIKTGVIRDAKLTHLDQTPVFIPESLLRHLLDSFSGPFYVAETETQRRRVVEHAVKYLASCETQPFQP